MACFWNWVGDGICDPPCNNAACHHDAHDCGGSEEGPKCSMACFWNWVGDGECDPPCNNAACHYDNHDCGASNEKAEGTMLQHDEASTSFTPAPHKQKQAMQTMRAEFEKRFALQEQRFAAQETLNEQLHAQVTSLTQLAAATFQEEENSTYG